MNLRKNKPMNNKENVRLWEHVESNTQSINRIKENIGVLSTDMVWIKKFQWMIFGTSFTAMILILIKYLMGG